VVIPTPDPPLHPTTRTKIRGGAVAELKGAMAGVVTLLPLMLLKESEVGDAKGITNISAAHPFCLSMDSGGRGERLGRRLRGMCSLYLSSLRGAPLCGKIYMYG
jgi:hypothetical protein